jgi:hypothetical protein
VEEDVRQIEVQVTGHHEAERLARAEVQPQRSDPGDPGDPRVGRKGQSCRIQAALERQRVVPESPHPLVDAHESRPPQHLGCDAEVERLGTREGTVVEF